MKNEVLIFENLFYQALRIRKIEEKIIEIYPSDRIQSPVHLSIGQEHHIAALFHNLKHEDKVFTTYRSHAVYLAKGGSLKAMFAELYGKKNGMAKGKAGSMHLCSPEKNMLGSSAIVGSVFSHAMGAAYAELIQKTGNISVCVTGEGATEEGTFHECLNFSSLKNIPVLYVIENNGLAIHAPLKIRQSYTIERLTKAYNIDFKRLDGFNMLSTYRISRELIQTIRDKPRPVVLEVDTYRYMEHVGIKMDYDKGYRRKTDYEKWTSRDPLIQCKDLIDKFSEEIETEIQDAVNYAESSTFPGKDELLEDVYL
jgi:TPP-dependent pyruvate/acetoin dehydrogenase alpha subunit